MKYILKQVFLFFVILFIILPTSANSQNIVQTLSKDSILVGERAVLNVNFSVPEQNNVFLTPYSQILEQNDTIKGNLSDSLFGRLSQIEILKEITLDTISIKNGVKKLEARVMLTSFDTGFFRLPAPIIIVSNTNGKPDTIKLEDKILTISTLQIDTTGFVPSDIKGQIKYPVTFAEIFPWILLVILIIGGIWVLMRYIKYKKANKNFFGKEKIQDPPHIVALRELEHLRNEKLWQTGKEKQYYTGITDTLRDYIERRFGLNAKEKTSTEILSEIKNEKIDKRNFEELKNLFEVSDLVKFAKYTPSIEENEEAVPIAVRFVNSTFMEQMNEEKEKGE